MSLALQLALRGQGRVEPNPMVGCVIVRSGRVIGQGYHRKFGGPHAEVFALRAAGARARGATVYVTLEPCNHTGKTPPCTDALIGAGIKRVIAAMKDPNPIVAGKGFRRLRAAGIRVDVGLLGDEAMALSAPFITFHRRRRPYVILKWAQSIDGKIATRTGDSQWITSLESRAESHALRARVDAVLVGVNTVLADDPDLTARLAVPRRVAARIVIDPNLRTPLDAKLVRTARRVPTLIVTSPRPRDAAAARRAALDRKRLRLSKAGCHVMEIPAGASGIDLRCLLKELHLRQMTNILVEGGGTTLGAFLEQNLADEARVFVAPRLIGGEGAPGPLRHAGPASMRRLPEITLIDITPHGPDLCYNMKLGTWSRRGRRFPKPTHSPRKAE
jgi:diaminohydroxyphosphoribosylaminopyrimidine deaminase / 5-amino-6-(5-phosphoribosylamino)uracil reductase